jgi:N6-adenosine-specific RNA methylase IME4
MADRELRPHADGAQRLLAGLPLFHFGLIMADPNWLFANWSEKGEGKSPSTHYDCTPTEEIASLPVGQHAASDAVLLMWATAPMIQDALSVMRAWGFTYKTMAAWAKQSSTGRAWAFGNGYWFRSAAEFLLLGTVGSPPILSSSVRNLIVAPVREHSRKPDEQYAIAEAISRGPYLELYATQEREGWTSRGDQLGVFDGGGKRTRRPRPAPEPAPAPLIDALGGGR